MKDGTASSYYQPVPDKNSLKDRLNLLRRVHYWKLVPALKLLNRKRYKKEARLLIEVGLIQGWRGGLPIRYQIKNGIASFAISPDQGESYLNYLEGNVIGGSEDDFRDFVNSIATLEAIIKTKACLIY